jgi:hypothetical protein
MSRRIVKPASRQMQKLSWGCGNMLLAQVHAITRASALTGIDNANESPHGGRSVRLQANTSVQAVRLAVQSEHSKVTDACEATVREAFIFLIVVCYHFEQPRIQTTNVPVSRLSSSA